MPDFDLDSALQPAADADPTCPQCGGRLVWSEVNTGSVDETGLEVRATCAECNADVSARYQFTGYTPRRDVDAERVGRLFRDLTYFDCPCCGGAPETLMVRTTAGELLSYGGRVPYRWSNVMDCRACLTGYVENFELVGKPYA